MKRSDRISVGLSPQQRAQLRMMVEAGEFRSSAAAVREAVRTWLQRRSLHAGPLGSIRLARTIKARQETPEPFERVELMFDAGDAKA